MTYVLSDIHGQRRRFESIMKQINLQPEDTLYVLGDVIDRNPYGIQILRQLMAMPNVKLLLGNHERMMLETLYYPVPENVLCAEDYLERIKYRWYRNGGGVTHAYLKRMKKSVRQEIFESLAKLPVNYEITVDGQVYILTHAAPMSLYPDFAHKYDSDSEFAVWKRFDFDFPKVAGKTVIFGHTMTKRYQMCNPMQIWHGDGWIGIDCGSSYPEQGDLWSGYFGRLACLRLDDMKEFYSEELFASEEQSAQNVR